MRFNLIILIIILVISQNLNAQIETSERNFSESKALLKDIIKNNDFRNGNTEIKLGYFSIIGDPRGDSVKLNGTNNVPYIEFDLDYILYKRWGLVGTYQRAQNLLNSGTENTASNSQNYITAGFIYKYILDETNVKNYFSVELKYFTNSSDFKKSNTAAQFVEGYTGYMLGLKRLIPATESFDIKGSLDIIYISQTDATVIDSAGDDVKVFKDTGTGLAFDVTGYYNYSRRSRYGLGLGILAYFNSVKGELKEDYGKDSYTQSYRSLYFSYNYLF